jgi:hypothetical protein
MPTKTKAASAEAELEDSALLEGEPESGDWEIDDSADYSETAEDDEQGDLPDRLSGQELLDFYAAEKAAGCAHADIAYKAGYYTVTKSGQERVMAAQFNEAMLRAQGIETGSKAAGVGRSHAGLTKARVSGQGILLVSQLATRSIGADPGSVFSVEYPNGDFKGPGAQILLTLTAEVKPVVARKAKGELEEPGIPLLDQAD